MLDRTQERSIPAILSDLLGQFPTLLRKETQLARVEMSEKLSQLGMGLALLVGGAVLLIPALVILLEAAVAALERAGFEPPYAALVAGGAAFIVGIILLLVGVNRLKIKSLLPEKTVNQLQQDASVVTRRARSDYGYQRAA